MRYFEHVNATTFEEASKLIRSGEKVQAMAGGTDLVDIYKDHILPDQYPDRVVNLKGIQDFGKIEETEDSVVIHAGAKLSKVASDELVGKYAPSLAEAAYSVASPLIRNIGTIGGNICQDVRCWYYRYPDSVGDELNCRRKGGGTCFAVNGENRYHSIFGGMLCGKESCAKECPAGTDIPAYMEEIRQGRWDRAASIILQYNPMPMMTSRICPHPCQDMCSQKTYGDSVNIHAVERSLADYIMEHHEEYYVFPEKETGKRIAIVGAGPGGLSAAYYLRKAGHHVVVIDRHEKAGGVLRYGIPHYRLPKDIVDSYIGYLEDMGVQFKTGTEVGEGKDITAEELVGKFDKIYFGTGAWRQPVLGIGGEELTQFGLNFLSDINTYLQKAVEADQKDNVVLVAGGGNVAMDVALTAVRLGAKRVKLVCLEQRGEMPASSEEVEKIEEEGVEIHNGWGLGRILTDDAGHVTGLESMKCTAVRNAAGRFDPQYDRNTVRAFDADYIILATGQRVDIDFLGPFKDQLKTGRGLIDADPETMKTKHDKIYAGGDAVTGPNIAIRAIRAGRVAAQNISREFGCPDPIYSGAGKFLHFSPEGVDCDRQNALPEKALSDRNLTDEDNGSFTNSQVLKEAGRCMNCGCYSVSPSDIAPVLIMLGATIVTTKREISASQLFTQRLRVSEVLQKGELVEEIRVPKRPKETFEGEKITTHYDKKRVRNAIDFAIVSLASAFAVKDGVIQNAKLVFGGVAPIPYEMEEVEEYLKGKPVSEETAQKAAELSIKNASPMSKNEYKLYFVQDVLKNAILRAAG